MIEQVVLAELDRYIDEHEELIAAFIAELVSHRTDSQTEGTTNFEREARKAQAFLADELRHIGLDAQCTEVSQGYPAVVAKLGGRGAGRTLALNGHFDVVPSGDPKAWAHDPWTLFERDGCLYGRGVTDMKSGIAAQVFALRALVECEVRLAGDVWVHYVSDEEVVGQSTRRIIETSPPIDGVVDSEPTGLSITPVEGGLVHLRIEVDGLGSHAGTRYTTLYPGPPAQGVNAIDKAVKVLEALRSLERDWAKKRQHPLLPLGFNSIMPGLFFAGPGGGHNGKLNIVSNAGTTPDYASIEFNIWFLPSESFDNVRQEIEDHLGHACALDPWLRDHPPRLTWKLNGIFYPPCSTTSDHPLIRDLDRAIRELGLEPNITGFGAASELAWYSEAGIGGTLFGPGSVDQAHAPNEFVDLSDVLTASKCLSRTICTFCGDAVFAANSK
jgi:acetylornithine deacetylase/succinyl-diaminopimelate desuccinylase family protein